MEAKLRRPNPFTAPNWDYQQEFTVDRQDHLRTNFQMPLHQPENHNSDRIRQSLHDIQLGTRRRAVFHNCILADPVDLICCGIAITDQEITK